MRFKIIKIIRLFSFKLLFKWICFKLMLLSKIFYKLKRIDIALYQFKNYIRIQKYVLNKYKTVVLGYCLNKNTFT